jgi:benzoyl-CoA-dihydrodiol lyase
MGATSPGPLAFETHPSRYRHWKLGFDGPVATLSMDVQEDGGLVPDYRLKLNSYDLGVDIELADAIQRLRFEHHESERAHLLRRCEHLHAARVDTRLEGELLQVYE